MLILPRRLDHAIRGVCYVANAKCPVFVKEVSARENIPQASLAKIFQLLARRGILSSAKGWTGGFSLALPPEMITMGKIIDALDGAFLPERCPLANELCGRDKGACLIYQNWRQAANLMIKHLESVTVQDLVRGSEGSALAAVRREKP